jgi:4-carboxymuconolactone decarboxylase
MSDSVLFERGLKVRRDVLGDDYVNANMAGADEFLMGFQGLVTRVGVGGAPGADLVSIARPEASQSRNGDCPWAAPRAWRLREGGARRRRIGLGDPGSVDPRDDLLWGGPPAGRQAFHAAHEACDLRASSSQQTENSRPEHPDKPRNTGSRDPRRCPSFGLPSRF